jgi:hypothetical protein
MAYSLIPTRPHVSLTSTVMTLIAKSICLHYDAWLFRAPATGDYYVLLQAREGGRKLLGERRYRITDELMERIADPIPADAYEVTLQSKEQWPDFERLNSIHHAYILPLVRGPLPSGYKSRSVALHYVQSPSLEPVQ